MSNQTFDTAYGRSITDGLQELAVSFDLSYLYGTAPQDYTINQWVLRIYRKASSSIVC
jgi:hypothetical protein